MIFYHSYVRCYYWGNLDEEYTVCLCTIICAASKFKKLKIKNKNLKKNGGRPI